MLTALLAASALAAAPSVQLAHLAGLYLAYDLPMPPKDARLIRYAQPDGIRRAPPPRVGFEIQPGADDKWGRVLFGCETTTIPFEFVTEVRPDAKTVRPAEVSLATALQFHLRGWHELAQAVFSQGEDEDAMRPGLRLAYNAVGYWTVQFRDPAVDRAKVARRLALVRQSELDTFRDDRLRKWHGDLLESLTPSKAKPGTVDSDIDELLDVSDAVNIWGACSDRRYTTIVGRGFDAVPALIARLSDNRLTRALRYGFQPAWTRLYDYRVKHFASDIILGFMQDDEPEPKADADGMPLDDGRKPRTDADGVVNVKDVRAWWGKAAKEGEETYAVRRVLLGKYDHSPNHHLLAVLQRKYPARLPEVFRSLLADRPMMGLEEVADAVAASSLPKAAKLTMLLEAAVSKNENWQRVAVEHLWQIAADGLRTRLHAVRSGLRQRLP